MVSKDTVVHSLLWKFLERCTAQLITLVIGIVLARLLAPEDFGALSILLIFVNLSVILTEAGFNSALIQKIDTDEKDYGTVLVISLLIAVCLYILLFFFSSFIASFYSYPGLDGTMKVIALVLFPNALSSVFRAKVSREFQFKKLFYANLSASVISGIFGVTLALYGFGLWALVIQQLLSSLSVCLILLLQLKWCPRLIYSSERARKLFSFGWKLMIASIIDTLLSDFRSLLIGKVFDTKTLGYYSQARQYPHAISNNVNTSIGSVMLPTMSSVQDEVSNVKSIARRAIKTSTFLVSPILLGFAAISDSFVMLLLTEKWAPSIILIKIICMMFLFEPIITINSQARNSIGKSGVHLAVVLTGKITDLGVLILTWLVFGTIESIAMGQVVSTVFLAMLGGVVNKKLIGYTYKEQIMDVLPNFVISAIMGFVVYSVSFLHLPWLVTLLIQLLLGITTFLLLAILSKNNNYYYVRDYVKQKLRR